MICRCDLCYNLYYLELGAAPLMKGDDPFVTTYDDDGLLLEGGRSCVTIGLESAPQVVPQEAPLSPLTHCAMIMNG